MRAHRLSYVIHHGPIPDGMHVLHSCDNPICTNPKHLRAGTNSENCRDSVARGGMLKKVAIETVDALVGQVIRREITKAEAAKLAGVTGQAVTGWIRVRQKRGLVPVGET